MKNLSVIFFSWLSSTIILIAYVIIFGSTDMGFFILFAPIVLGVFCLIALICLYVGDWLLSLLRFSKFKIFISKLVFTLLFYLPLIIGFLQDSELTFFPILSFLSTVSILTYYNRDLHSSLQFSHYKKSSIMETEQFTIQHPEQPQQKDNSQKYLTKGFILLVMGLVLWLGTLLVDNLATTRESVKEKSLEYFKESWGDQQKIAGPFLSIPYEDKGAKGVVYLMPKKLDITSNVESAQKGRGIYENVTFRNQVQSKGVFDMNQLFEHMDKSTLRLDKASLCFGINDITSVIAIDQFKFNGKTTQTKNGWSSKDLSPNGIFSHVNVSDALQYTFDISVAMKGTESIEMVPLGENTQVQLLSNWKNASFNGKYIPNQKPDSNDKGVSAKWNIQQFNRAFPQAWKNNEYNIWNDNIKIGLHIPVNNYKKTTRAINYAVLVIGLVFITFYIIEINGKKSIHPVQYLLIGLALCLFYGLLLSFSELISFDISYLIAAFMTVFLISAYIRSVLSQTRLGVITAIALGSVYTFLYILMIQESYALVLGNLGLFIILAAIMYFTRKMNKENSPAYN